MLARAWQAAATDLRQRDALTHGFHSYPAALHPAIARTLVAALSAPAQWVFDPFCGGGTVLIEARAQGRHAAGGDLSPLALRLTGLRTAYVDRARRRAFLSALHDIARQSAAHIAARAYVAAPIPANERRFYAPHVLRELAALWAAVQHIPQASLRGALEMVFSAILHKCALLRSDTDHSHQAKRLRKGLVTEWFERKGEELSRRWAALARACGGAPGQLRLQQIDARAWLHAPLQPPAQLIVSSPPYAGTYDYAAHHARRLAWLGLSADALSQGEIGARRDLHVDGAAPAWDAAMRQMLMALRACLAPMGQLVLVLGDGYVAGTMINARRQIEALAPAAGLRLHAYVGEMRPHRRPAGARREWLLALRHACA
ncbi:MAG: TRM11 family SAM-dependent methyltransferase [Polyangiales bacterium]